ncbi:DUF61 family protein [Methanobacterium alkalithermotolerans]|uniref:UPF0216 protein HYG87_03845 n=1 Tax=Methanobacterium alkalithermotolerans TaxID=2731220 RepID=A0A8T8K3G1_9EURY|nr:DUF61 family protein [Methanobacterium alkalithermotolerans]QUH22964.1 DUF61 family protein [Methanobacterium alkalithermotolerans]RJS48221.1 MAG: hypothetical protein CIT03_09380 [Methanobacterium sp.]
MNEDDRSHRLLKKQILILNRHLPKRRKTLQLLLEEDRPHVVGSDGTRHRFKKDEINLLKKILDDSDIKKLKLPIYMEIQSVNSGAKISGKLETEIVCKILKIEECSDPLFIYRADLKNLRKILPSTTQYIFLLK